MTDKPKKRDKTPADEAAEQDAAKRERARNVVLRAIKEQGCYWPEPQGDPGRLSK